MCIGHCFGARVRDQQRRVCYSESAQNVWLLVKLDSELIITAYVPVLFLPLVSPSAHSCFCIYYFEDSGGSIMIVIHIFTFQLEMRLCSFHMFHVGNKIRDLEATFRK